jgi:hypothetical protein
VNVPAGVRVLLSLARPTPADPTRALTGPSTAVHPVGRSSHAVSIAVVALDEAATTVTTCVEEPGSTPRGRRGGAGAARVGAAGDRGVEARDDAPALGDTGAAARAAASAAAWAAAAAACSAAACAARCSTVP